MNAGFTTALGPVWMRLQSEFVEQQGGVRWLVAIERFVESGDHRLFDLGPGKPFRGSGE